MEKGTKIIIEIEDITDQGKGIGKLENLVIFVEGDIVVGDKLEIEINKIKKNYMEGRTVKVVQPSPFRQESFCQYSGICGGCLFYSTTREGELLIKEKWVRDKLTRLGGLNSPQIKPIVAAQKRFNYRNKGVLQIKNTINKKGEGTIDVGFFKKKTNRVIDCKSCKIQEESVQLVGEAIRKLGGILSNRIKSVVVKTSLENNGVMVNFIIEEYKSSKKKKEEAIGFLGNPQLVVDTIFQELAKRDYVLESVFVNGEIDVAGSLTIVEKLGTLDFEISPNSFYQVNTVMAEKLLDIAKRYVSAMRKGREPLTILDLYCGVGTIGLYASEKDDNLFGIEVVKDAIINANRNAVINKNSKALFYSGKAEDIISGIALEEEEKFDSRIGKENANKIKKADVVIIDPPRAGCHNELIEAISKLSCERLIYISCDAGTMARDIRRFSEKGFELIEATPVDMFPGTGHVETVCALTRI